MLSLFLLVGLAILLALYLSVKYRVNAVTMLLLQVVLTSSAVAVRSQYVITKIIDKVNPVETRAKQLQQKLEAAYISAQTGAYLNLVLDYKKATDDMYAFAKAGISRYSEEEHLRYAELVVQLCKFGGEPVCSGFFTGDYNYPLLREAMNQLSEKDAQDWMNLLAEAVKYDVAQRRHTRVSAEEFAEAFTRIFYTVPVADRAFVKQKLTEQFEGKAVSVSDAARAAELIYASALLNSIPFGVHYLDEVATLANKNERPNPKLIRETAPEFVPNVARVRVVSDEEAAAFTKQFGGKGDGRKVSTSETFTLPLKK